MPIDFTRELPLTLQQAAAHVPRRRRGRKAAVSTLHRWATRGIRGVVLETLQVGGTRCTSLAALQRFFERLSQPTNQSAREVPHQQRAEEAARELDERWGRRSLGDHKSTTHDRKEMR